jgi:hypothetical protein
MTRKDFRLIAEILRDQTERFPSEYHDLFAMLRVAFADGLRTTNPAFDRERFYTAARPRPENVRTKSDPVPPYHPKFR